MGVWGKLLYSKGDPTPSDDVTNEIRSLRQEVWDPDRWQVL